MVPLLVMNFFIFQLQHHPGLKLEPFELDPGSPENYPAALPVMPRASPCFTAHVIARASLTGHYNTRRMRACALLNTSSLCTGGAAGPVAVAVLALSFAG